MSAIPSLRLVVPILEEGDRFAAFARALADESPASPATTIVVVDDGSGPRARAIHDRAVRNAAEAFAAAGRPHRMVLVSSAANQGKGAAIRLGWQGGGEEWLGFVDGDGAVPAREVWRLASMLHAGAEFDGLLSSRQRVPGRTVRRHPYRAFQGRVFSRILEILLRLGLRDPQCGLKFFRASRLGPLLPVLRERRWLLDPEILLLLANAGARLVEAPIDWFEHGSTRVVFGIDPLKMLVELLRLRRRIGRRPSTAPAESSACHDASERRAGP